MKWSVGYGLTDKRSYGGSNTTGLSTQPSANAYLRSSRRYTVLRSKGTLVYGVYVFLYIFFFKQHALQFGHIFYVSAHIYRMTCCCRMIKAPFRIYCYEFALLLFIFSIFWNFYRNKE